MFPIGPIGMIVGVFIELGGVFFFSYIMGQIQTISEENDAKVGFIFNKEEFENWMFIMVRFNGKRPIPKALEL